jgi:hypothetical protein
MHIGKIIRLLKAPIPPGILVVLLFGCQSTSPAANIVDMPTATVMLQTTTTVSQDNSTDEASSDATPTNYIYVHDAIPTEIAKAWATSTRQAELYPKLQPAFPASLESFKQFPGATNLNERLAVPDEPLSFGFETTDDPERAAAHYHDLAKTQGWQPVSLYKNEPLQPIPTYYYGDYAREHIYGYYLGFTARKNGPNQNTSVNVWIMRTLPVSIGATGVVEEWWAGTDTSVRSLEFFTEDSQGAVLNFYKDILPRQEWRLVADKSSDTRLFWKIGGGSHAQVVAEREPSGRTRVKVEIFTGCC